MLAVGFYIRLSRNAFSSIIRTQILQVIFLLSLGQVVLCLIQTFWPNVALRWFEYNWLRNNGRPYGIFQQVNLLASFLASGLLCGYLLLMDEVSAIRRYGLLTGLAAIAMVLTINQSRTGEIGAFIGIVLITVIYAVSRPRRCFTGILVMILAAVSGWWMTQHITVLIDGQSHILIRTYSESDGQRWAIIQITWQMIKEKPWMGWGYGTFATQFTRYLAEHPELHFSNPIVVTHPHNELLFAWFQGALSRWPGCFC